MLKLKKDKEPLKISFFKWIFQKKEILKYLNELSLSKIILSQRERVMILDALCCDEYKAKVQAPATRTLVRGIYRGLLAKFRSYIREEK